jgi:hypothetical protein
MPATPAMQLLEVARTIVSVSFEAHSDAAQAISDSLA